MTQHDNTRAPAGAIAPSAVPAVVVAPGDEAACLPRFRSHDYACAVHRAIQNLATLAHRLEIRMPDDPYVALLLHEDVEVLTELSQRLRADQMPLAQPDDVHAEPAPSLLALERLGEMRAALTAVQAGDGAAKEIARAALHRDDYLQVSPGGRERARVGRVVQPVWMSSGLPSTVGDRAPSGAFQVGDKVTFVNDSGLIYPGKTIIGIDDTGARPRYYLEPSDAPWFAVEARNLRPVAGTWAQSYPRSCPITGRPYVMSVHHPELGLVPLYGGPTDLYSIPQPLTDGVPDKPHEQELFSYRFSLESNSWVSTKRVGLRIVQEEVLAEVLASREGEAAGGSADRAERPRHG